MFTIIKDGKTQKEHASLQEASIAICRFRTRIKLLYPRSFESDTKRRTQP